VIGDVCLLFRLELESTLILKNLERILITGGPIRIPLFCACINRRLKKIIAPTMLCVFEAAVARPSVGGQAVREQHRQFRLEIVM
jgi:hypothetical protein